MGHGLFAVNQTFVKVHIDNIGPILNLLLCHPQSFFVLALFNQLGKPG